MKIDWRCKENPDEFNRAMLHYVVRHLPEYYQQDHEELMDTPEWQYPSYVDDIIKRIQILVSLG